MKISEDLAYHENNKERQQKKLVKDIKVFLEIKKKKSNNMIMNNTKIYNKIKNRTLLSIEKNTVK